MEARIVKEIKGAKPADVKELLLDECKSDKIVGLTDEFSGLATLSLANVGLKSLEGLPKLPLLTTINLADNHLESGLEVLVQNCPMLNHVNLAANPIKLCSNVFFDCYRAHHKICIKLIHLNIFQNLSYPDSYISQPSEKGDETDVPQKKVKNDGEPMDSSEVESKESAMES
ncbi:acidic leucine-rich nuclear phosphoprotein 32 family member A [Ditylenchus destructor]|uniref:Acidic leucine-rich nuclear phosphoprotein 32 family member A n=1 Tax=Ditylenchus destructor TaxID=166010 RepID=A0AAD4MHP5_9BILA|nr:acidic leucine-rich nuclear phosphoprotein 32 family member A [Ditylenchus destructor]